MKRIPSSSCTQLRRNTLLLSLLGGLVPLVSGCNELGFWWFSLIGTAPPSYCLESLGTCPPPNVEVLVNTARVQKSIWVQDDRIGEPEITVFTTSSLTFCVADIDPLPGEELVFRGRDGLLVVSPNGRSATIVGFIPRSGVPHYYDTPDQTMAFLDVDSDGYSEYLFSEFVFGDDECDLGDDTIFQMFQALSLRDHFGALLWQRCVDYLVPESNRFQLGDWARADIDGTGFDLFAITTADGVELFTAEGLTLTMIGDTAYGNISFANVDDDASLELVTQVPRGRGGEIATWELDGVKLASFVLPDSTTPFWIVRYPEDGDRDSIVVRCQIYDIEGTPVDTLPADERGWCRPEGIDYGAPPIETECPSERGADYLDEDNIYPQFVRFDASSEAFRVEISYSIELVDPHLLNGPVVYRSRRTILKIHDPTDELVYHEVIATESNPGSFLVIPSDVPGEEVLLVADGTRIVAYFLGETPEE